MTKIVLSSTIFVIFLATALITPVQAALRAVARGMVAPEGAAELFVAFAVPDILNRLLEDIAQHALFAIFARAAMAERREAARQDIAARRYVRQRVGAAAARPGTRAEVARDAFHGRDHAGGAESDA